jgi:hypothetical protein
MNNLIHSSLNRTFQSSLTMMQSERTKKLSAFGMPANNMLMSQLNNLIRRLNEAGITKHLIEFGKWFFSRIFIEEVVDPRRILSLNDLGFGFVIWLAACFVSFSVFVMEILIFIFKNNLTRIVGLFELLSVLKARLANYHDRW